MRRNTERLERVGLLADDLRHFLQVDQIVIQPPLQQLLNIVPDLGELRPGSHAAKSRAREPDRCSCKDAIPAT